MVKNAERQPRPQEVDGDEVASEQATSMVGEGEDVEGQDPVAVADPAESEDSEASEVLELPVLPLRGTVVFPLTVVPLAAADRGV